MGRYEGIYEDLKYGTEVTRGVSGASEIGASFIGKFITVVLAC